MKTKPDEQRELEELRQVCWSPYCESCHELWWVRGLRIYFLNGVPRRLCLKCATRLAWRLLRRLLTGGGKWTGER